jgi:hypothetical protein
MSDRNVKVKFTPNFAAFKGKSKKVYNPHCSFFQMETIRSVKIFAAKMNVPLQLTGRHINTFIIQDSNLAKVCSTPANWPPYQHLHNPGLKPGQGMFHSSYQAVISTPSLSRTHTWPGYVPFQLTGRHINTFIIQDSYLARVCSTPANRPPYQHLHNPGLKPGQGMFHSS